MKKRSGPIEVKKEAPKDKMTNKERNRYNDLQKEIESLENKMLDIKEEMKSAPVAALVEMQKKLDASESKMEKLFTEWAELEAKL